MVINIFQLIFFVCLGLILLLIIIFRHQILSFLQPEKYSMVTLLEADNSVNTWLQRKNSDLTFTFNEGTYNMFDLQPIENPSLKDNNLPPILIKKRSAIYRSGRLGHLFYNEGNQDPIDFRHIVSSNNPQLTRQLEKTEVMRLFVGDDSGFMAFIKNALPFIIIIGIVIIIFLLTRNPQQAAAVNPGV